MKQVSDLCRPLILEIEQDPSVEDFTSVELQTLTNELLSYHDELLNDVEPNYVGSNDVSSNDVESIEGHNISGVNSLKWYPIRLTRDCHEFLDFIKEEKSWSKAKAIVSEKTGNTAFEFIKAILFKFASI